MYRSILTGVFFFTTILQLFLIPAEGASFSGLKAYEHAKELTAMGERLAGTEAESSAAEYIYDRMVEYGLTVTKQEFCVDAGNNKVLSQNIIGVKKGDFPKSIYLTAHYDSVGGPGAVDNASGVGVLLELARIFGNADCKESLVFIAFGAEELGLCGSRNFVSDLQENCKDDIQAVINIDAVGYGEQFEPGYVAEGTKLRLTPFWLLKKVFDLSGEIGLNIEMYAGAINGHHLGRKIYGYDNGQHKSDHMSFLEKGIPAVSISFGPALYWDQGGFLHSDRDTIDKIDVNNLKIAGEIAVRLVNDISPESALTCKDDPGSRYFIFEYNDNLYSFSYAAGITLVVLSGLVGLSLLFFLGKIIKKAV